MLQSDYSSRSSIGTRRHNPPFNILINLGSSSAVSVAVYLGPGHSFIEKYTGRAYLC